jgi:methylated-DNA-protein-cysteine methyltransferase related protein
MLYFRVMRENKNTLARKKTFSQIVVELALMIPHGKVTTYGALARMAGGGTMSSQTITSVLAKAYNNGETRIPFHRIVYSDGRIWSSPEYDKQRKALYKKEGIEINDKNKIIDFEDKLFDFK